jgi:hypothetical protein
MNPASDSTGYTTAPPSYAAPPSQGKYGYAATADSQPLLAQSSSAAAEASRSFGAIYDQPEEGDIPDDFKYGTSVADSSLEIRNGACYSMGNRLYVTDIAIKAFVRKVRLRSPYYVLSSNSPSLRCTASFSCKYLVHVSSERSHNNRLCPLGFRNSEWYKFSLDRY